MFDPKQLLDQFLGGQGGNAAWNDQRGNAQWDNQRSGGGIMDRVGGYARDNPMLTGGIAGGLAGLLLGRGFGGDLLKYGGMAVIGGLAYKAYRDYQASQQAVGSAGGGYGSPGDFSLPPADSPFAPSNAPQGQTQARRDADRRHDRRREGRRTYRR